MQDKGREGWEDRREREMRSNPQCNGKKRTASRTVSTDLLRASFKDLKDCWREGEESKDDEEPDKGEREGCLSQNRGRDLLKHLTKREPDRQRGV